MKKNFACIFLLIAAIPSAASDKDSTINYNLPDSVKAVQFMTEIRIGAFTGKEKHFRAGIKTDIVSMYLTRHNNRDEVTFAIATAGERAVKGVGVYEDLKYNYFTFKHSCKLNETYRLLIAQAGDSAGNFSVHSGYIFLPEENKWKLIGTYRTTGHWVGIKKPGFFYSTRKRYCRSIRTGQVWVQRNSGSWKNLRDSASPPLINLFGHVDSIAQRQTDIKMISDSIAAGKTDVQLNEQSVYYKIMKEGTGRPVSVSDTVVAFYKGYLFANGEVFDQTKDKPATFPLRRLIRGWQIGLPFCKVGGKIKLVIPSDLAYSIRTRAAKIPPNSILVFEIEVVDAKPAVGSQ